MYEPRSGLPDGSEDRACSCGRQRRCMVGSAGSYPDEADEEMAKQDGVDVGSQVLAESSGSSTLLEHLSDVMVDGVVVLGQRFPRTG